MKYAGTVFFKDYLMTKLNTYIISRFRKQHFINSFGFSKVWVKLYEINF